MLTTFEDFHKNNIFKEKWDAEIADGFTFGLLAGGHGHILLQLLEDSEQYKEGGIFYSSKDLLVLNDTLTHLANGYHENHPLMKKIIDVILEKNLCTEVNLIYTRAIIHDEDKLNIDLKCSNSVNEINALTKLFNNKNFTTVPYLAKLMFKKYPDKVENRVIHQYLNKCIQIANVLEKTQKHVEHLEIEYNQEIQNKDFVTTRNSLTLKKIHAFNDLISELTPELNEFICATFQEDKNSDSEKKMFKRIENIFEKYKPILEKQRSYKRLFAEIALAIFGLGIGYGIAALINKGITGHYTFFKDVTASTILMDEFKKFIPKSE
jgi:hypothetical protein